MTWQDWERHQRRRSIALALGLWFLIIFATFGIIAAVGFVIALFG